MEKPQFIYLVMKQLIWTCLFYRGSDEEYSDDDDMSWKVRRAAAKCLSAVIATRHEMLSDFYRVVSPALIQRFKGRVFHKNLTYEHYITVFTIFAEV